MQTTIDQLYNQALRLPDESKASLAERLVEYLEMQTPHEPESYHVTTAKRRRDEIRSGSIQPMAGEEAPARVRDMKKR
ncbi:MAG: addiction module protein [bacterium]|nr:addiction module protein [bacterium]